MNLHIFWHFYTFDALNLYQCVSKSILHLTFPIWQAPVWCKVVWGGVRWKSPIWGLWQGSLSPIIQLSQPTFPGSHVRFDMEANMSKRKVPSKKIPNKVHSHLSIYPSLPSPGSNPATHNTLARPTLHPLTLRLCGKTVQNKLAISGTWMRDRHSWSISHLHNQIPRQEANSAWNRLQ